MNRRLLSTGVGLGLLAAVATSSFGIVRDDEDNLEFIGYKECISGKDFKIEEVKAGKIYGNSREYRITTKDNFSLTFCLYEMIRALSCTIDKKVTAEDIILQNGTLAFEGKALKFVDYKVKGNRDYQFDEQESWNF